jgi:alpha-beta hydrolase superfamily lysophospholipase
MFHRSFPSALLCWAAFACMNANAAVPAAPTASEVSGNLPAIGRYVTPHGLIYAGRTGEPPDQPAVDFYDPATQRHGALQHLQGSLYRSSDKPELTVDLQKPDVAVSEDRHVVDDKQGRFGFSVWRADHALRQPLIVLLEGADDSTRDMGFLIPYFVSNGMDVLTFDQRGTGLSTGNWRYTSPADKADDVVAALHSLAADPAIDFARVGVWGPSNGGWVAPIIARSYPLAFMILKSASGGTIIDNVKYEVRQDLLHGRHFSPKQVDAAMRFEQVMFSSMETGLGWEHAASALEDARTKPWFPLMRMPPGLTVPPPPAMLASLRASLLYDPRATLQHMSLPTLLLFGQNDRNVDVVVSERDFRDAFKQSGMRDLSVHEFPGVDHLLTLSPTGYISDESEPARFAKGYPTIMIDWLHKRGLLGAAGGGTR